VLPPEAYFDQAWFDREQRELFGRTWNLVAYETDVADPGNSLPVQVGVEPVLLLRGRDGVLRAFLNMCRHRGMALTCEAGSGDGTVRCGYHGWEYGSDGALERIPQRASQFADIDPTRWGLVPVGIGRWDGLVFVNPDPRRRALRVVARQLADARRALRHEPAGRGPPAPGARRRELEALHREPRGRAPPLVPARRDARHVRPHRLPPRQGRPPLGQRGAPATRPGAEPGLPRIAHLPASESDVLRANLIFPNVPTSSSETQTMTYQVIPTGPESCELDIRVRAEPGGSIPEDGVAQLLKVLRDEDGSAVEQIQRVLRSPRFEVGPLASAHEAPIVAFQHDVLDHLT
jgi:Rieske 2Fe-2S family protein